MDAASSASAAGTGAAAPAASVGDTAAAAAASAGDGQAVGVGLGAAVALSQASGAGSEVDEETKVMIRQTAEWFHANPEKSKVRRLVARRSWQGKGGDGDRRGATCPRFIYSRCCWQGFKAWLTFGLNRRSHMCHQ